MIIATDDRNYPATGAIADVHLSNADIRNAELDRARHALAYLKRKIGNAAMRELLKNDIAEMTARVRGWVEQSNGKWQTGTIELTLPGPSAQVFHDWYTLAMANDRETELRAGHPEHFVSHPASGVIEVVENIGETELPWQIFYRPVASDRDYPMAWDPAYPVRFGAEIVDIDGLRVGFTMHQSRDEGDTMLLKLNSHLPAAAPPDLIQRHLHHFAVEFRNWTRFALLESLARTIAQQPVLYPAM